jgi:hypothetical protein
VDVEHFAACMAPLSVKLKPGFQALVNKLHQHPNGQFLSGHLAALDESVLLDNAPLREHLDVLVTQLTQDIKIPSAADPQGLAVKNRIDSLVKNAGPFKEDLKEVSKRSEAYLKAYFKKGISQLPRLASLDESEKSALQAKIAGVLKRKADDPAITKVMGKLAPQLQKISNKIANKSSGFISRDGTSYAFPGVTDQGTQTNIDHSQIEADVIRIILEALRDTYAPLPVLANSTAASVDNTDTLDFAPDKSASITVNWHNYHRDVTKTIPVTLTAEQFQDIEAKGRSAESSVAGAVGKAIRGGSWGALNNEAVARSIETAAGVLARHTAERAEWCVQALRSNSKSTQP